MFYLKKQKNLDRKKKNIKNRSPLEFKKRKKNTFLLAWFLLFFSSQSLLGYEIFIYRPHLKKEPFAEEKKFHLHGEIFADLLYPCDFPSYNDFSGPEDRWNFGFQCFIFFTKQTTFLAQLITHDDGHKRTKFDWHFSLRHSLFKNFVLILGHDSNHDSDYQSLINKRPFFLNRNYAGCSLPFKIGNFYVEPFTWFLYHTNQKGHLDLSGQKLRQEYGLRLGFWIPNGFSLSLQVFAQTQKHFSIGQAFIGDLIMRIRLSDWIELSWGAGIWSDIKTTPLGNKQKFHKLIWGIAIPF